jgi:hypothetical protein
MRFRFEPEKASSRLEPMKRKWKQAYDKEEKRGL